MRVPRVTKDTIYFRATLYVIRQGGNVSGICLGKLRFVGIKILVNRGRFFFHSIRETLETLSILYRAIVIYSATSSIIAILYSSEPCFHRNFLFKSWICILSRGEQHADECENVRKYYLARGLKRGVNKGGKFSV